MKLVYNIFSGVDALNACEREINQSNGHKVIYVPAQARSEKNIINTFFHALSRNY